MANKKRKIYFSSLQARIMLSHELQEDRAIIKAEIFDRIVSKYKAAVQSGDFSLFQHRIDNSEEVFMVSNSMYQ